jgi:hypothetical protein
LKSSLWPSITYGAGQSGFFCVGGGTVHYTASQWRFHEIDFVERSRWGSIEGTGFADWPLTYAELEPYYVKAEYELGVSGLASASPFDPPRSKPFPLPALPIKSTGVLFDRGCKKMGFHPVPIPAAILSQPYQGRKACNHCGFCEWFGCDRGAKSSTLATVIPAAEATGRCEIRSSSYVRRRCSPTNSKRCWLAVETGMRAGELAGLRCCDVDPFKKLVRVPQTVWRGKVQTPKAKNSKRDIPIPVEIVNALCEHMGGREEGFVFATKSGRAWNGDLLLKAASS